MQESTFKRVLLIAGPTASGKSALAIERARTDNGVVINADASQVYRELSILSARPTAMELQQAPHVLYGHKSGADDYSVADWLRDAQVEIENAWQTRKLPIVVGGTGLYFMALEKGLAKVPPIDPVVREKWRSFERELHAELHARHKPSAERLNPADRQRLIRALEVFESTGKPLIFWQEAAAQDFFLKDVQVERIFKSLPRDELYARADKRFDSMLEQGGLEEVRNLPKFHFKQPIMKAIGVPELQRHLSGELSLAEAAIIAKTSTRHYIKRQMTWFRGQMKEWISESA